MDLEIIILSEVSQKEKDKYHMISLICGIQNMTKMNQKQNHGNRELTDGCQRRDWRKDGMRSWS